MDPMVLKAEEARRDFDDSMAQVTETVSGATQEERSRTEERITSLMAEAVESGRGAAAAFAQAMVETEEEPKRVDPARRARTREKRKRERQNRRKGRR